MCYVRAVSNLSPLPTSTPSTNRARKRRAKRGIVANYIHEISPRHRAASTPVASLATATPTARPVSESPT